MEQSIVKEASLDAATVFLVTALPDYIKNSLVRGALSTAVVVGRVFVSRGGFFGQSTPNPLEDTLDEVKDEAQERVDAAAKEILDHTLADSAGKKIAVAGATTGAAVLALYLQNKIEKAVKKSVVGFLTKRGVKKPHTILAAGGAVLMFGFSLLEAKQAAARDTVADVEKRRDTPADAAAAAGH